jgi:spore coat polysaccharide biosynthesis predicted glycosyltransferase SpsG
LGIPNLETATGEPAAHPNPPASAAAKRIGDPQPDWLIVDHYALDATWEHALRPAVRRILVIDDLANRRHDCDLLLDQNFAPDAEARDAGLLPSQAQRLLGPHYALLRPDYPQARQRLRRCTGADVGSNIGTVPATHDDRDEAILGNAKADERTAFQAASAPVRRVLIFFGGTDSDDLSGRALEALTDPALATLSVDLVVGANNPHRQRLNALAEARGNTRLHPPRPHLADLMAAADLAIGAGGATAWERCCLGLPSLVVSIAENQRPACEALAAVGVIAYLGHQDGVATHQLTRAIEQLREDTKQRQRLSAAGAQLVDGCGLERVAHRLPDEHR